MAGHVKKDIDKESLNDNKNVWSTLRIDELILKAEEKGLDYKDIDNPFFDNKPDIKRADILFEYTNYELDELRKCAVDVVYFAQNYCKVMTDNGYQTIILRDYQIALLRAFQENRLVVLKAPRQVGKTVCSSIFLLWYLIFNHDKNAMVLANVGATAEELLSKIKEIIKGLPFFLKPGINIWNVMSVKFDNNCKIMAKTTTKTSAIGFTIHFLYMDEFAHINSNFIDSFFQSTFPTISSSEVSRVLITSTPNGLNKFYEIYNDALEGRTDFKALSVDWFQVPGKDEEWKKKQIANLGSEEIFNQEYGCQFLSSSTLLLDSKSLNRIKKNSTEYVWRELIPFSDEGINYENLKWHPKFDIQSHQIGDPLKNFVISIDTSGGVGGDYQIVNIFRVVPKPIHIIENSMNFEKESDFFSLIQIGTFRDNKIQIDELKKVVEILILQILGVDRIKVILEIDFRGERLHDKLISNEEIHEYIFLYTKHSDAARKLLPGIKLGPKTKLDYCEDFKGNIKNTRIIPNEAKTVIEICSFGLNTRGNYSSQSGHDDLVITLINISPLFRSGDWDEICSEVLESLDIKWKELISNKMSNISGGSEMTFRVDALKYKFLTDLM